MDAVNMISEDNFHILKRMSDIFEKQEMTHVSSLINELLSTKPCNDSIAELFLSTDFFDCVTDDNFEFIATLIKKNADIGWFLLIFDAFIERDEMFLSYCQAFEKYYHDKWDVGDVKELYDESIMIEDFCDKDSSRKGENIENIEDNSVNMDNSDENEVLPDNSYAAVIMQLQEKSFEYVEKIEQLSSEILELKAENQKNYQVSLEKECHISEMSNSLSLSYRENLQLKRENLMCKLEVEQIKKKNESKQFLIDLKILQDKNSQLIKKIEAVEEEKAGFEEKISLLSAQLEKKENEIQDIKTKLSDKESYTIDLLCKIKEYENQLASEGDYQERVADDVNSLSVLDELDSQMLNTEVQNTVDDMVEDEPKELIQITDGIDGIRNRSIVFSQVVTEFYENSFIHKPQSEQDNIIFIKMMELSFAHDKVLMIKKLLNSNLDFSRLELYKIISRNPGEGELEQFCNLISVA